MLRQAWISSLILISINALASTYTKSSIGPTSVKESQILWDKALSLFKKEDLKEAEIHFERLVERYPGTRNYTQSHLYLGMTRLKLSQPKKAIPPLQYYVKARGFTASGLSGRTYLARAYLGAYQNHEALMTAGEIIQRHESKRMFQKQYLEALLLKAWAEIGLEQDKRAKQALDSFRTQSPENAESIRIQIALNNRQCETERNLKDPSEENTLKAIESTGNCLMESLILYKKALTLSDSSSWIQSSHKAVYQEMMSFRYFCLHPPYPNQSLSSKEKKTYREELVFHLKDKCSEVLKRGQEMMTAWGKSVPKEHLKEVEELKEKFGKL